MAAYRRRPRLGFGLLGFLGPLMILRLPAAAAPRTVEDSCLMYSSECLSLGTGNFHIYQRFSERRVRIQPGDALEYDIFIERSSPAPQGAIDATMSQGKALRDVDNKGIEDDLGLPVHPATELAPAYGRWYRRRAPLDRVAGNEARSWTLVFEGDLPGRYTMFLDNIVVRRADGSAIPIYLDGAPPALEAPRTGGYSAHPVVQPVERSLVADGADLSGLIGRMVDFQRRADALAFFELQASLLDRLMRSHPPAAPEERDALARVQTLIAEGKRPSPGSPATSEALDAMASRLTEALVRLQPFASRFGGALVGHAHLDFQWKWPWTESLDECRRTFGQALKFMDEYDDFVFSQSSSALYMATESNFPDVFEGIRRRVAEGRWELLGGRVSEGDTNLISAEAHARHFLYGQRYFRERFGKTAIVGWEPDTFGHCATMPDILANGGCAYYYFMRGGPKPAPLFQWEGPGGSRVWAFDEGAMPNAKYGGPLTGATLERIPFVAERTGRTDALLIYGMGDHGGGPTRESIEQARRWQAAPGLPAIRFSTAEATFRSMSSGGASDAALVYRGELNAVFDGCYSAHGDAKRGNRDGEAWTATAEALAAIAARHGFPYPGLEFRRNWEDLAWNSHHDTLGGTSIHSVYEKSRGMYARVIESGRAIANDALRFLAARIDAPDGAIVVFNPIGWTRDAVVEFDMPAGLPPRGARAVAPGQPSAAVQAAPAGSGRGMFVAQSLPPYGYRCYRIEPAAGGGDAPLRAAPGAVSISRDGVRLENDRLRLLIDPAKGTIQSLFDKRAGREAVPPGGSLNRLESYESGGGGGAWHFGRILSMEALEEPVSLRVVESGPERATVEFKRRFRQSPITQRISLAAGSPLVDFEFTVDWKELGQYGGSCPSLRIAMDADLATTPAATYEIPFGSIERPLSDGEQVALKWADLSDGEYGISLLNDSKHGYVAQGRTLRLTLVRSSAMPDPAPDQYVQTIRYALYPHAGDWRDAGTIALAAALNHPVVACAVPAPSGEARGLPAELSFVQIDAANLAIAGIKRAEDDDDLVVRLYESAGRATDARLATAWPIAGAVRTNFIEDTIGEPVKAAGGSAKVAARPHEIQTLKLQLRPVAGVVLSGTRGPGPARDFQD